MKYWFEDDFLQTWLWVRSGDGGEWVGREEEPKSVLISACEGKNALLLYLNLMFHEWAFVYSNHSTDGETSSLSIYDLRINELNL